MTALAPWPLTVGFFHQHVPETPETSTKISRSTPASAPRSVSQRAASEILPGPTFGRASATARNPALGVGAGSGSGTGTDTGKGSLAGRGTSATSAGGGVSRTGAGGGGTATGIIFAGSGSAAGGVGIATTVLTGRVGSTTGR